MPILARKMLSRQSFDTIEDVLVRVAQITNYENVTVLFLRFQDRVGANITQPADDHVESGIIASDIQWVLNNIVVKKNGSLSIRCIECSRELGVDNESEIDGDNIPECAGWFIGRGKNELV